MAEDILDELDDDFDDDDFIAPSDEIKPVKKKQFKKINFSVSKKTIFIMVGSLALLISLALGIWLLFFKAGGDEGGQTITTISQDNTVAALKNEIIFKEIVDLEPFERLELKEGSPMGVISMNLSLELTDPRFRKQIVTMEERIRQIITDQVGKMTWLDLKGPEGKIMLKYDLLQQLNSIFPKAVVRNVYFTNLIMQ